ncbi:hypothetical protein JB92DRAFT_1538171 [Gautieria morchelliformis]|nr:hypothetical protein JB92DRAFT_1538171 [Gautieria morchelliformis]
MPSPPGLPPYLEYTPPAKPSSGGPLSAALTTLSHLPTPFISTFLLIHLSAPALANLGGSSLSSQVMLLGREYYQGSFSEPWLLFAPLGIHVTAGVTKRLLSSNPLPRRPSLLTATAYPLLLLLPIHILTHRVIPSDTSPPISALSPSELNFEFVKAGLAGWPVRSSVLYAGLVLCGVVHTFEGWDVILRMWGGGKGLGRKTRRILAGVGIGTVLSGLFYSAKESLLVLQSTLAQINASYLASAIYRFNWA